MRTKKCNYLLLITVAWLCMVITVSNVFAATSWNGDGTIIENALSYAYSGALTSTESVSETGANATVNVTNVQSRLNSENKVGSGRFTITLTAKTSTYYLQAAQNDCDSDKHYSSSPTKVTATITNLDSNRPIKITAIEASSDVGIAVGDLIDATTSFQLSITASPQGTDPTKDTVSREASLVVTIEFEYLDSITLTADASEYTDYTFTANGDNETYTISKNSGLTGNEFFVGTEITPVISEPAGYTFLGWRLSDGRLIGKGGSFTINSEVTFYPVLLSSEQSSAPKAFQVGVSAASDLSNQFWFFEDAVRYALSASDKTIVLLDNYTLPTTMRAAGVTKNGGGYVKGSDNNLRYIIPQGVTLLVPFDDKNTVVTSIETEHLSDAYANNKVPVRTEYRKLVMPAGTSISIASGGALSISSLLANQFIGQIGNYGAIYMDHGSNITVQSGGYLYSWGYIFPGANGVGTVTVESGGNVYEPLSIMDYPGSASNASALTGKEIFPMRSYSARNVEVPMTLKAGANEYVFYCLYGERIGTHPGTILMIGNGNNPFFRTSGTTVCTKSVVNGTQHVTVSGDVSINSMTVTIATAFGTTTISSSDTNGIYLPSGFQVAVESGTLTLNENLIMCEGSKLEIGANATLALNGKNLYVLDDTDDGGAAKTSNGCGINMKDVHGKYYTNVPADAILDINGTLDANGGFYTSTNNASIISSQGTGKVQINTASGDSSVNIQVNSTTASTVPVHAASLQNADGSYVENASAAAKTYYYVKGKWTAQDTAPDMGDFMTRIVVGDSLDMQFAFKATLLSKEEGNYVTVSKTFADAATNPDRANYKGFDYTPDQWETISVYGTQYYVVTFPDISGKEMCDTITLTLTENEAEKYQYEDSVRDYALRILNTGSYGDANNKMLVDLLYYGAAAQTYYGYGTGDLANAGLESYTHTTTVPTIENNSTFEVNSDYVHPKDITIAKATTFSRLELTNGFYLHVTFNGLHKNMTAVADFDGSTYPLRFGTDGKSVYFTTQEVLPMSMDDARTPVTIQVYDRETPVCTVTDSIESYVYRALNDAHSDELETLLHRIIMFSDSVKQYVESWNPAPVKEG